MSPVGNLRLQVDSTENRGGLSQVKHKEVG